ncbi:MAG: DUF1214 domain-containing protein [Aliihoeflea sp.]
MLKSILLTALTLVIALGGGAGSVWLMIEEVPDFGAMTIGEWSVNPTEGTPQADPYAKARFAREGELSLGVAEGAQFIASRDATGQPLRGACDYVVTGSVPASRFWTLHAVQPGAVSPPRAVQSLALLRESSGSFSIALSRHPAPGNWLQIDATGPYRLVLAVYDTPTVGSADLAGITLPRIVRERCNG